MSTEVDSMDNVSQIIGERIRIIRESQDLTQEELAAKAHLAVTTLGNLERGDRDVKLSSFWKTVDALGISYSELFEPVDMMLMRDPEASPAMDCYEWLQKNTIEIQKRLFYFLQAFDGEKN